MAMTYASLIDQVMAYLDRSDDDTLNQVPNFILQAEQRICRESKTVGLEMYVQGSFVPGQAIYQKPALWRRNISFTFNNAVLPLQNNQPILLRSKEWVNQYWPDATERNVPKYYCDYGYENFLVAPTPDFGYAFELAFLGLPPLLSIANQTNWLTDYAPDVLLYATLLEAAPYLKVDERIPVWLQLYERGLNSLNTQDKDRILDRSSDRDAD